MPFSPVTAWAVVAYILLAILPGLALMRLCDVGPADPGVRMGLAAGVGLAVQPVIYLWAHLVHLPLGPAVWWLVLATSAVGVVYHPRKHPDHPDSASMEGTTPQHLGPISGASIGRALRHFAPAAGASTDHWAHITLLILLLAVLASRWWAAHALTVPLWGDSVHHTMIVRLFLLHGGLVDNWLPFAPLSTFTYHFGFHATTATLAWMTGLPAERAVLVAGQVLMVLQVLTVYAFVAGVTRRPWAGIGAALAAGGLSIMPGYYINWGRYTQLAGQVVLPAAALATVWAARAARGGIDEGRGDERRGDEAKHGGGDEGGRERARVPVRRLLANRLPSLLLAALLVAGLALTHYLVAGFYALLMVAWWLVGDDLDKTEIGDLDEPVDLDVKQAIRQRLEAAAMLLAIAIAVAVIALPWIPQVRSSLLGSVAVMQVTTGPADPSFFGIVNPASIWGDFGPLAANVGLGLVAAVLLALVAVAMMAPRMRVFALGWAWLILLSVAMYPQSWGLPMHGLLKDFTVAIAFYLPFGLILGGALGYVMDRLARGARGTWAAVGTTDRDQRLPATRATSSLSLSQRIAVILIAATCVAVPLHDRNAVEAISGRAVPVTHMYVSPADERAFAWIRANTPPDAVFLVSSALAYGGTVLAGDDGGWWIPLLADRRTTLPPITYGLERSVEPGYRERMNYLAQLWQSDLDAPATRAALTAAGVTYAYAGPTGKGLDRGKFKGSRYWRVVYEEGGAVVFERVGE